MAFRFFANNGGSPALGGKELRAAALRDHTKDFEDRVRAFVCGCSAEELQLLLGHFTNKIGFFLEAANKEENHLVTNKKSLLRTIEIIRIVLEEIGKLHTEVALPVPTCRSSEEPQTNKRKLSEPEDRTSHTNKKLKISAEQGNWQELKLLGRGAFGSVFLVKEATSGVICAKKSIRIDNLERQLQEIDVHKNLDHRNIVAFLGEDRDEEFLNIFLEYVGGGTLGDKIRTKGMRDSKARSYFTQLIQGVKYLHSLRITHRDLKPENLLLSKDKILKIGDFGLAAEFAEEEFLSRWCGTPAYMAPEVFARRYKGAPVDIWACGVILFKLLTGQKPWGKALSKDSNYAIWSFATCESRLEDPWSKLSEKSFRFIESILVSAPEKRATLSDIEQNDWFRG